MGNATQLYQQAIELAHQKRQQYDVASNKVSLSFLRKIYRIEGVGIHHPTKRVRNLRAAYYNDGYGCDVLLNGDLPKEAKIFSLIHELKHHYLDQDELKGLICFRKYDEEPLLEKTAEVFAAEFLWPEQDFAGDIHSFGIRPGVCSHEAVVHFKKTCGMPVSYTFIVKRLEWFRIIQKGEFAKVKWQLLEWDMYGKPFYRR